MAVNYVKDEDNYKITTQEIKKRYKCFCNGNYCIISKNLSSVFMNAIDDNFCKLTITGIITGLTHYKINSSYMTDKIIFGDITEDIMYIANYSYCTVEYLYTRYKKWKLMK
jgi:hypothetical protein